MAGDRVDREASGRQSIHLFLRHRAEIAGPQKNRYFVQIIAAVDRIVNSKTGIARVVGHGLVEMVFTPVKRGWRIGDRFHRGTVYLVN